MNVKDLLDWAKGLLQKPKPEIPVAVVKRLIETLEFTEDAEIDCGEVYQLLDQYAEAHLRGDDAAKLMPLVKQHLEICRECHEEFEALLSILEGIAAEEAGQA
jgi:hypothetical protein